jgi:hypothetical protein
MGSMASIRAAAPEASMTPSRAASVIMAGAPPEQAHRPGLAGRLEPGDQVAEPLGTADPGGVHERGQAEQFRAVGQPGRPQPGRVKPRQAGAAVQRGGAAAGPPDTAAARHAGR